MKGDISPQTTVTTSNDMSSKNLDPYDDDEVLMFLNGHCCDTV